MNNEINLNEKRSYFKIASWNINKFESCLISKNAKVIVSENLDIIFLQEFPTNNIDKFLNEVNGVTQTQYDIISQQSSYEKDYNITLVLVKVNLRACTKTIPMIEDMPFKLRLIELELFINDNTINILGLHCPIYVNKRVSAK